MKVYWGTRLRGFFRHLTKAVEDVEFVEANGYYEINSAVTKLKSILIRSRLLNPLGIFQVIDVKEKVCDCYGSFNRFLHTDKPYFIYLENPTALYHYTLGRIKYPLGRKMFKKCLDDPNLRQIICMSNACRDSFEKVNIKLPEHVDIKTIYPYVPKNENINSSLIEEKSKNEYLECLYCVQGIRFVSKGGLEVLSAYEKLRNQGVKIHLTVITKLADISEDVKGRLYSCEGVSVHDFSFSYEELEKIYAKMNLLIQVASDESFGLTILEAMKGGCAIIASQMYAFPEMVEDGKNGFLLEPKHWMFDKENIPNPKVWNHRKKTLYSKIESERLVEELSSCIAKFSQDREMLSAFSKNSLNTANTKFGEDAILSEWKLVLENINKDWIN